MLLLVIMAAIFEIEEEKHGDADKSYSKIDELDCSCHYNTFFQLYMKNNLPCVIKNIGFEWTASKYWVKENEINFPYLVENYGESVVTIYDCNKKYYNSQKTHSNILRNYINDWNNMKEKLYYIKDWHMQNEFPNDCFYEIPIFFASDWLNEFLCENNEDDYRFVYIGPMGTWTPFHADVFTSYSWSVNIYGQKRWVLFPPGEEHKLKDELGNLPYDLTCKSLEKFRYLEIIQNANEVVFIPSGWYHQVWNTMDTISINHNWINGCNIKNMWQSLEYSLTAVEKEIADCKNMNNFGEHCQIMLKASYGLDFTKFYQFLEYIAIKRIKSLEKNIKIISFNRYEMGKKHVLFDLQSIKYVLELFLNNFKARNLEINEKYINSKNLLYSICKCIDQNA